MRRLFIGLLIGISISAVAAAKQLPELQYFHNAEPGEQQKINVAYAHIEELERKVSGMQQQITILHAKFDGLPKLTRSLDGKTSGTFKVK